MAAVLKPIYIDLPDVCAVMSLGEGTIQRMIREKEFPAPRKLSGRRVAWLVREIEEWAENRPVSDLLPPKNTGKRKATNDEQPAPPVSHPEE